MRKLLFIFSIVVLSIVLLGQTSLTEAQIVPPEKLQECCRLGQDVTIKSGKADTNTAACLEATDKTDCSKGDKYCTFKKNCTVGENENKTCAYANKAGVPEKVVDAYIGSWGMVCLLGTVYSVTNWIFYILLIAVVLLVVIGGAMYMMSAGDAEKAGKGKSIIIYGIIGLALALVAKLIPSVVRLVMGV